MKKFTKRAMSMLLILALVVSLFASLALSASAASYTYNSGKRGTVCTSLSSKAKSYYSGSYTYASLSAKSGSSLRTALRALVNQKNSTVGYNGLRTYMKYTDAYQGSSSKLMLFYSSGTTTSSWDSGKTWNREHMWPQSLGGNAVEADLNAMRPADPTANSSRNNNKYGEVASGYTTCKTSAKNGSLVCGYYKNDIFEPLDNVKGDCARVVLYDYVMASSMSSVTVVFDSVSTLLSWCKSDPVDTYEMSRNDAVQSIQGSRNPFIDYPELGWKLLGYSVPSGMSTPSNGLGTSSGSSSSGSTSSGSSSSGSSSSGSTSSGSTASGSTTSVSAGQYIIAAKVGSKYYAMPNSFASKITGKSVSYSGGSVSASSASAYVVTLAKSGSYYTISNGSSYLKYSSSTNFASSSTAYKWSLSRGENGSYRFTASGNSARGIVFSSSSGAFGAYALTNVASNPTTYYDVELIPVTGTASSGSSSGSSSSGSTSSGSTSGDTYTLVTSSSDLTAGKYIVVAKADGAYAGNYNYYVMTTAQDGSYAAMSSQGLNYSSLPTSLTCDASSASKFVWTLSGSRTAFQLSASEGYLAGVSGSTKLTTESTATSWAGTYSSSYKAFRVSGNSRYISLRDDISTAGDNGNPLFCTASSTSTGETYLYFYKLNGSSSGSSSGSATGGTTKVTVSFSGATASTITTTKGSSVTLPTPSATAAGYTFVGWTTSSVSSSTSAPTYYKAGSSYTATASVTLKALYKYTTTSSSSGSSYVKVTSTPSSWAGTYLIVYEDGSCVMNGGLTSVDTASNYKSVSISGGKIAADSTTNACAVTIAASGSGYTIKTASGYYIGRTANSNGMNTSTSTKYENTISLLSDGTVNIKGSGGAYLRFNKTSGQTRFRFFKSTTYSSQQAVCLYKLTGGTVSSVTYYTTNP